MKTVPTDREAAAIAVALLRYAAERPQVHPITDSRWRDAARRDGVLANVPATWRE